MTEGQPPSAGTDPKGVQWGPSQARPGQTRLGTETETEKGQNVKWYVCTAPSTDDEGVKIDAPALRTLSSPSRFLRLSVSAQTISIGWHQRSHPVLIGARDAGNRCLGLWLSSDWPSVVMAVTRDGWRRGTFVQMTDEAQHGPRHTQQRQADDAAPSPTVREGCKEGRVRERMLAGSFFML